MPLQNNNAGALHGVTFDILSGYEPQAVVPFTTDNVRDDAEFIYADGSSTTRAYLLEPSVRRLTAVNEDPVLGSHTHALHSPYLGGQDRGEATFTFSKDGGQSVTYTDALAPTMLRASNLSDNPILGSHTHALYSAYIAGQVRGEAVFTHSKDGLFTTVVSDALAPTILRAALLADPVLGSHTHALHSAYLGGQVRGEATFSFSKDGGQTVTYDDALAPTVLRASNLANPILGSHTHALHSAYIAGQVRDEAEFTFSKDGLHTYTATDALAPTVLRAQNLAENPILLSHTHALHSAYIAGQERGAATFTFSKDGGQTTTYNDALQPTILRAQKLTENPILYSHTHALYSAYQAGQVRGAATFTFSKDGGQSVTYNDALAPTVLRAQNLANNPILYSHTHALHSAYRGGFLREDVSYTLASGQTVSLPNVLNPTVRRINALKDNPVTGSHTHALHGKAGTQQLSYAWENPQRFKQELINISGTPKTGALHGVSRDMLAGSDATKQAIANSGVKTGALHGRAGSGPVDGLVQGFGDSLKKMLFGGSSWPMARYYFYVLIGGTELGFQAIDGLEAEIGTIEYRDSNSPFFGKERMPGMVNYSRVTLKKGVFAGDTNSNKWFAEIAQNRNYTKRRTIVIAMMDHNHIPQFIWRYEKAFLTKVTPTNLDAESDGEIAIEEMEFIGRAWYLETLIMKGASMAGGLAGAIGF